VNAVSNFYCRDELLNEWVHVRASCRFTDFPRRAGITETAWRRAFERARADGDPRAVYGIADWFSELGDNPQAERGFRPAQPRTRQRERMSA